MTEQPKDNKDTLAQRIDEPLTPKSTEDKMSPVLPAIEPIKSDVPLGLPEELTPEGLEWRQQLKASIQPITDDDLKEILGTTIKHDDNNKVITLLCMLTTYTEEDQVNLGYIAESSTGKSYIPLELANYFPKDDLIKLGYASPTAFFHDYGTMLPDPTDKRDIEPEKKRKIIYIDLEKKILIFLDQPHSKLLEHLRPLLSHDDKEITVKISDRREKSGLRTKTVVIRGYPTVVFCSAKMNIDDQEKTRLLLLSPEVSQDKLKESITLKIEKESNREEFKKTLEQNEKRRFLANRIADIKSTTIKNVLIPIELRAQIEEKFFEKHEVLQSRNQRDISRLMSIIKGYAILNFHQREQSEDKETGDTTITVNNEDLMIGFRYYAEVAEANELGLPPEIYEVYKVFKDKMLEDGLDRKEIQKIYFEKYRKYLGRDKLKQLTDSLEVAGLWIEVPDTLDKRKIKYVSGEVGVNSNED
jgi:hypothetical protein